MSRSVLTSSTAFGSLLVLLCWTPSFAAKPVCGDGICQGKEASTCPQDCDGGGGDPPANPAIAFGTDARSQAEIGVMDADGGNQTRLPRNTDIWLNVTPRWSPLGDRIAFDGNDGIFTMSSDGTNLSNILPGVVLQGAFYLDWSPGDVLGQGDKIAFVGPVPDGTADIFLVNPDGTGLYNLTQTPGRDEHNPSWSPDSTMIAVPTWTDDYGFQTLVLLNLAADATVPGGISLNPASPETDVNALAWDLAELVLPNEFGTLAWDASDDDVDMFAFRDLRALHVISLIFDPPSGQYTDAALQQVTGNGPPWQFDDDDNQLFPAWSPDGQYLVFLNRSPRRKRWGVYSINVADLALPVPPVTKIAGYGPRALDWNPAWTENP